jgi:predicted nucleotide-binding protein
MPNINYVLLHFLNREIGSLYEIRERFSRTEIHQHYLVLVRAATLVSDSGVIIPAASLFEVPDIEQLLQDTKPLQRAGLLFLYSPTSDLQEYAKKKLYEFRDEPDLFPRYSVDPTLPNSVASLVWLPRVERSASHDIASRWRASFENDQLWDRIFARLGASGRSINSQAEREIREVPERLEGRAFVYSIVAPLLPAGLHPRDRTNVELLISQGYLYSYMEEYRATILIDTPLGELSCGVRGVRSDGSLMALSFRRYQYLLGVSGFGTLLSGVLGWNGLLQLRRNLAFRWINRHVIQDAVDGASRFEDAMRTARLDINAVRLRSWFRNPLQLLADHAWRVYDRVGPLIEDEGSSLADVSGGSIIKLRKARRRRVLAATDDQQLIVFHNQPVKPMKEKTVFLIHGRDDRASQGMRTFLRDLGLYPLEWGQAVRLTDSGSPYILDVVRAGMEHSQGALVLFTPDEKVELRSELCHPGETEAGVQSRPNVWIEAGMALAMHPNRTIFVEIGPHRSASDLSGLSFVRLKSGNPTGLLELAQRLQGIGCAVDLSGTDFLKRDLEVTPVIP